MQNQVKLAGRVLLTLIFIMSFLNKLSSFQRTAQYMESQGMTFLTEFWLTGAIILLAGGGLSVLLGWKTKWGVMALIIFMIPATLIFHSDFSDQQQVIQALKNIAIIGGLLTILSSGPGTLSIDYKFTK